MSKKNNENKKDNKYNAENEIIIGVTAKPKQKVRVENNKTTRTNTKVNKTKSTNNRINKNLKANIKSKELTKENQIKKINRNRIRISILLILFIAICGTIYYLTTPIFNVASIDVYGNSKNSVDTYISLSEINLNETNIFAFTNTSIEKRLKENSYVEKVKIEKKFPNKVELHITERNVDYIASYLNSYAYLNNQGYLLEINKEEKDVLIIEGLKLENSNIEEGKRLSKEDLTKLDTVLKITNYLKYNSVESRLTKVNVADTNNYILEFVDEDKIAYIGDSTSITEKMTAVTKILEVEKGKKGKIHANEQLLKKNRIYFSEEKKGD